MNFVYGPVPSRRLGYSLGIDIVPYKTCTLDCIYCQLGKTTRKVIERRPYLSKDDIIEETKRYFKGKRQIDFITFSGSGEPTLHSEIGVLIKTVKSAFSVPVAVLTNGTLLYREDVQQELLAADVVMPSLDAASSEMFKKINRPHNALQIDLIIEGLKRFRELYEGQIWLEIMLIKGFNDEPQELSNLRRAVSQIRPDKIQLNTVLRPPSERYAKPLSSEEMAGIREFFTGRGEVIGEFQEKARQKTKCAKPDIVGMTRRRPLTTVDIANVFGISAANATLIIERLKEEGVVEERRQGARKFYFYKNRDRNH